jgi:ribA/ribD-fused uncharacterized protein
MSKYTKYTFFWDGPFSQWDSSTIVINDRTYTCCEQYMMYKKALLFGDSYTAGKILSTSSPREQKKLGREVSNFNPDIWASVARDIVFRGNVAKFTQSEYHRDALMLTTDTLIVEASPYDKIWGIGMGVAEANNTRESEWKGLNWLGQVLTEVRESLEHEREYINKEYDPID